MRLRGIPFEATDWSTVPASEHPGVIGVALWRTRQFLEGEIHTELEDGRIIVLKAGMSYQVADGDEPHRSRTANGARLFIVD